MDIQSYTARGRSVIQTVQSRAVSNDHQQIVPLHIMAALLEEEGGLPKNLLQMAGASIDTLNEAIETGLSKLPQVQGGSGLSLSSGAAKVFAKSEKAAKSAGDAFVTVGRLLLATVLNADKELKTALDVANVDSDRLAEAIKSVRKDRPADSESAEDNFEALQKYAHDLTQTARDGKLELAETRKCAGSCRYSPADPRTTRF